MGPRLRCHGNAGSARHATHLVSGGLDQQPIIANLGALKNLTFKSVGDNGADEYDADFEKGALRIYMSLDEQGRIAGVNFVPR
jgi:hypothetical protein